MSLTIDRTPKPCVHKIANHQHGDRSMYVLDRCRCLPCCHAASVYEQARKKRNAYGRSNLVDADPVRQHVAALTAAGIGLKRIVSVSGVPQGALWKLMYGKKNADGTMRPSKRVTKQTADKLLALNPADPALLAQGAKVDSTGAARRLQALTCLGWSVNRLAAMSGIDRQVLDQALHGGQVVAAHTRSIAALYDSLWDRPAPADDHRERISVSRTRNRAKAAGWASPLAWDDDTIDDPAARPISGRSLPAAFDEIAVERAMSGDVVALRPVERAEVVHRLTAAGYSASEIAPRVGIDARSVQRIRDDRRRAEDAA